MVISDGYYNLTEGALSAASSVAATEAIAARTAVITATGAPFVKITPLAKRIAADQRIDLHTVHGSGFSGKIFAQDLERLKSFSTVSASAPGARSDEIGSRSDVVTGVGLPRYSGSDDFTGAGLLRKDVVTGSGLPSDIRSDDFTSAVLPRNARGDEDALTTDAMVAAVISADENVAGVMRMNESRRSTAAKAVKSSAETASVTQHMETDVTELIALLGRMNADKDAHTLIPLKAFFLKALAVCIKEKERFRLRLAEAEDAYLLVDGVNIGLQIDTGDGVFTPILRDTDHKSLEEIASDINYFTDKAKRSGLDAERRGGAITLLDKGDSGIYTFTPIINQPEAAILGIGSVYKRLVMTERSIENRQFIMQSLTFDHRIVNGAEADDFQKRLKELIEHPQTVIR